MPFLVIICAKLSRNTAFLALPYLCNDFGMDLVASNLQYCNSTLVAVGGRLFMDKNFTTFIENITLTQIQSNDAKKRYTGVCEKLYDAYYTGDYDEEKKFLFGSYKTLTNVRPLTSDQDVDVLFKIPQATFDKYDAYESNGQEALLQEVREILKEKYKTTDKIKAWGKVVLVNFSEGYHNVEVLPALELDDKTFKIPNAENGGSWEIFDPRQEISKFNESNGNTDGLTRDLAKMLKAWAHNNTSMSYKSCDRMDDIITFLSENYPSGKEDKSYSRIVFDYFDYMSNRCDDELNSYINTALGRARKALDYEDGDKPKEASEEWRKIFGDQFPKVTENPKSEDKSESISSNPIRPWLNSKIRK